MVQKQASAKKNCCAFTVAGVTYSVHGSVGVCEYPYGMHMANLINHLSHRVTLHLQQQLQIQIFSELNNISTKNACPFDKRIYKFVTGRMIGVVKMQTMFHHIEKNYLCNDFHSNSVML